MTEFTPQDVVIGKNKSPCSEEEKKRHEPSKSRIDPSAQLPSTVIVCTKGLENLHIETGKDLSVLHGKCEDESVLVAHNDRTAHETKKKSLTLQMWLDNEDGPWSSCSLRQGDDNA